MRTSTLVGAVTAALLALGGCGSDDNDAPTGTTATPGRTTPAAPATLTAEIADPGFPSGSHGPGSVVTGTWTLTCPGGGPVRVRIDPFGGLLNSDTGFRITLR